MTMIDPATGQVIPVQQQPQPAPVAPAPFIVQMPPAAPPAPTPGITQEQFMEMVEKVRKEEKDKLYPQIEELKSQVGTFTKEREDLAALAAAEQARLEEEARQQQQQEMTAIQRLEEVDLEWKQRFNQQQQELETERALRAKEAEFAQLAEFRARRIAEESDNIVPQLVDMVGGNTPEQIEQSIARMKEKSAQMVADIQAATTGQRRQASFPVSSGPPIDMAGLGSEGTRTLSADDIRGMDMSEYAEYRQQLLGATSQRVQQQGLYAP